MPRIRYLLSQSRTSFLSCDFEWGSLFFLFCDLQNQLQVIWATCKAWHSFSRINFGISTTSLPFQCLPPPTEEEEPPDYSANNWWRPRLSAVSRIKHRQQCICVRWYPIAERYNNLGWVYITLKSLPILRIPSLHLTHKWDDKWTLKWYMKIN